MTWQYTRQVVQNNRGMLQGSFHNAAGPALSELFRSPVGGTLGFGGEANPPAYIRMSNSLQFIAVREHGRAVVHVGTGDGAGTGEYSSHENSKGSQLHCEG